MNIRCQHCGALIPPERSVAPTECHACGRSLDGSLGSLNKAAERPNRVEPAADEFEPLGWSDERMPSVLGGRDLTASISGESETISPIDQMQLGHLPTAGDSIDISELLSDGLRSNDDRDKKGGQIAGSDGRASISDSDSEGWRVRDGRGVVYEFENIEELRHYLSGYPDRSEIRISQGLGPFRDVGAFEDLVLDASLDLSDESDIRSKFVDDSAFITAQSMDENPPSFVDDGGRLEPDYQRANRGRREHLQSSQRKTGTTHQTQVSEAVMSSSVSMGPPMIMLVITLIFGLGLFFAHDALLKQQGPNGEITVDGETVAGDAVEKAAMLKEARDALDAGKAERAVRLLNDAIRRYPDSPDIFLELALALHQTNREKDAKAALKTYRELKGK